MAKTSTPLLKCRECGWTTVRWVGRCGECQAWGTIGDSGERPAALRPVAPATAATPMTRLRPDVAHGRSTGIAEFDRVLGGGLVPGAVVLLAGEPGVGKSTLLLEVSNRWSRSGTPTLYVTAEESAEQVRLRAGRTGAVTDSLFVAAEGDLATIVGHLDDIRPGLLVVDSVQTVASHEVDGAAGSITQVRAVTQELVRQAKQRHLPVIVIGHVTKDGAVAGPRLLEHLVDVVLNFEGDRHSGLRTVRATKNRFGPSDELGCFNLDESGIVEVPDPSGVFVSNCDVPASGTSVTVALEGRRPLLGEIQALVARTKSTAPRRVTQGLESSRVAMILAVLERKADVRLHNRDVYVSTVGGARLTDPAVDLAVALSVASAADDLVPPPRLLALGEVGLSGELRRAAHLDRRLSEAARLGFTSALVPWASEPKPVPGMRVIEVPTVGHALIALRKLRLPGGQANPAAALGAQHPSGRNPAWEAGPHGRTA